MPIHVPQLLAGYPDGWHVKESVTLLAPDGQANVIFSSEPLPENYGLEEYVTVQGNMLFREFPGLVQRSLDVTTMFGGFPGYLRVFDWSPPDGVRVTQLQGYYVVPGRGYTATATTSSSSYGRYERTLREILAGLELRIPAGVVRTVPVAPQPPVAKPPVPQPPVREPRVEYAPADGRASPVRWYCTSCGRGCTDPRNDEVCTACGATSPKDLGETTFQSCAGCRGAVPLVASYCRTCGHPASWV